MSSGMAALLTPNLAPDEQDFIQAYEEVREKYKGMEPPPPYPPSGQPCSARWVHQTDSWPLITLWR